MNLNIKDKVAIVTGGGCEGSGIGNGRAAAILLAKEGCRVVVVDVIKERADKTVEMIKKDKGKAFSIEADVTVSDDCREVVKETIKKYKKIDILNNNVGFATKRLTVQETEEGWKKLMNENLFSIIDILTLSLSCS